MGSNTDIFATECGIDPNRWQDLKEDHETIKNIYNDYKNRSDELNNVAVSLSSFLQRMPGVHSVRWRIKSPEHLVAKICRKKQSKVEKYSNISTENYREVVTDLIGIRVLHLLKGDFTDIHSEIISTWDVAEKPVVYLRDGDQQDLRDLYGALGLNVENHEDGYRSIHYIILTNFTKNSIKCELQVRTIFEEGWSEIDHKIRYPEFTNEPLVLEFVNIFNRLSGAADEMGTFALKLAKDMERMRDENIEKETQAAKSYNELEEKIKELEEAHHQNKSLKKELSLLRLMAERARDHEVSRLSKLSHERRAREKLESLSSGLDPFQQDPNNELNNRESLRRYGFSLESYRKAASTSKASIAESIERQRRIESANLIGLGSPRKPIKKSDKDT